MTEQLISGDKRTDIITQTLSNQIMAESLSPQKIVIQYIRLARCNDNMLDYMLLATQMDLKRYLEKTYKLTN